ncbi:MAG: glycosyltransferase [Magnetococcus sp. WYHC-3]
MSVAQEDDVLRVAVVGLTHPFRGGIAHYTTRLCQELALRHKVALFTLRRQYPRLLFPGKSQWDQSATPFTFPHAACLDSLSPFSWWRCAEVVEAFRPHGVVIQWWHPFFAPAFGTLARCLARRGRAVYFLCHNVRPHDGVPLSGWLTRWALAPARGFLVHSQVDARRLRPQVGARPIVVHAHPPYDVFQKGALVPLGGEMQRSLRRRLGIPEGGPVVLFFGLVRRYKGLDVLLKAMVQVGGSPPPHLVVAGEFYQSREPYARHLALLQEQGRLTLLDRYVPNEQVPELYAACDLLAVPYREASQSGVLQIARALGRPVVASRVGGLGEAVRHGVDGWLVPPGDSQALARVIEGHFNGGGLVVEPQTDPAGEGSWAGLVTALQGLMEAGRTAQGLGGGAGRHL